MRTLWALQSRYRVVLVSQTSYHRVRTHLDAPPQVAQLPPRALQRRLVVRPPRGEHIARAQQRHRGQARARRQEPQRASQAAALAVVRPLAWPRARICTKGLWA